MRYLYYCNSAYQLLNALNLNWHRKYANFENIKDYKADLVLLNAFKDANRLADILKKESYFDNITIVNRVENKGRFHLFKSIINIVCPSVFLKKAGCVNVKNIEEKYDYIVAPKFSKATAAIWQINKKAKLQLYEDGLASYKDDIQLESTSYSYKKLYKLFNNNRSFYDFESMYLNNLRLYTGKYKNLVENPKYNVEFLNHLKDLFVTSDISENKFIYWIGQFIKDDANAVIEEVLCDYKEDCIYRPHPRYQLESKQLETSKNNDIWELYLLSIGDINKKCFITIDSTAVFSPKILYNQEPYLILTYKMLSNKEFSKTDTFVSKFKALYDNPMKIKTPSNIEEFRRCVKDCIKNIK